MNLMLRDFGAILPMLVLFGMSLVILVADLFLDESKKHWNAILAFTALAAGVLCTWLIRDYRVEAFGGLFLMDRFTNFFNALFCIIGGMTLLLSVNYLKLEGVDRGEFYALLLMSTVGMMLMAGAGDLITLFLGIETMSIPVYVLAGFRKKRAQGMEASLKYFLIGAFAAGFLLYGIALVYGAAGSTRLVMIAKAGNVNLTLLLGGVGLIIVGLGFKVSAVPFHMWTPDVYQGAPTPVTAFMAVGVKAAGFAALLRVFMTAFPNPYVMEHWREVLYALAVVTMTVGNIIALAQTNLKRMFAYSSIAHAGYLLIGMVTASVEAASAILFYLISYAIMNMGAFGCIILTAWKGQEGDELKDFQGVGFEKPVMAMILSIFLLSLAGIPPTAGFLAKFYIFNAAIQAKYYWLAVIGVLNAVVAAYYYLRVLVVMYMQPVEGEIHPEDRSIFARGPLLALALILAAILTLFVGLWPQWFYTVASAGAQMLFF